MADTSFKSGPLAIPMMVIGLLAAGALAPHLTPPSTPQAPRTAFSRGADGGASAATPGFEGPRVPGALDLLAEYFGTDPVNASPDPMDSIRRAAARHATSVEFLIATVPDPIDSYETWQFDPQIDAVRQGIEASGYLLDRFFLPDTLTKASGVREVHKHWPGVVLFRSMDDPVSLLVLFLIPETPVAGIHQEPFRRAIEFVDDWMEREGASSGGVIRILGPTFSGSTRSIVLALVNFDDARERASTRDVTIVSGSATNDSNRQLFEEDPELDLKRLRVRFRATIQSNSALAAGMKIFLCDAGIQGNTASLSEGSTAYGSWRRQVRSLGRTDTCANLDTPPVVTVKYPFNIAQLRADAGRDSSTKHDPATGVIPTFRPLSFEDQTVPTDQFPLRNPATMSSSVELVLATLLEAVRREHVRIVNIDATDVRDKLFLIKEVRERAPNVLVTSTGADLFEVHPDQARWLTGLVIASTYPLHISSQDFVYPFHHDERGARRPNGDLTQFSSASMEGHYNAAIALLNYTIEGAPLHQYEASPRRDYPTLPKLLDYGGTGRDCAQDGQPGVWISVIGDGQVIPLRVYCGLDEAVGLNYVFRPRLPVKAPPGSTHDVSATGPTMMLIAVVLSAGTIGIGLASRCRRVGMPATVGALGLALCGALIPLLALAIILSAEALQLFLATEAWWASATVVASAWGWWLAAYAIGFQLRSRALAGVRAVFAGAAVLVAWYVVEQLAAAPQLFLQRTLDIGTKMSPLLPLTAFGAVPVVLAAVELRRLKAFGLAMKQSTKGVAQCCDTWRNTLASVAPLAPKGLTGLQDALVDSYRTLFFLPGRWKTLPVLSTIVAFAAVFAIDPRPVLSVEGRLFGLSVVAVVLCLQWVLSTAIAQFLYLSCATAQLLTRLARHPKNLPWDLVPKELSQSGLVPKAPRLRDLAPLAEGVPGALHALQQDLEARPSPRWFQSETWQLVRGRLTTIAASAGAAEPAEGARDDKFAAISVVFVVRELLSRLSFSVYLIGPALALLVVLFSTLFFDRAHALLGLIWIDVLLSITVVMSVFIWMDRDTIISGIRHTTPGTIDWNWGFIWKVVVYVVLPLVTLFAAQFPDTGSGVIKLLEPVQKLPGL